MYSRLDEARKATVPGTEWILEVFTKLGFRIEGGAAYAPSSDFIKEASTGSAGLVIDGAIGVAAELGIDDVVDFMNLIIKPFWEDDEQTGAVQAEMFKETEAMTKFDGSPLTREFKYQAIQLSALRVACAYAVQSLKAEGNSNDAWRFVSRANYWIGLVHGAQVGAARGVQIGKEALAKAGASARHAENRKLKMDVFEWCDRHMQNFKSMDKAAEAIHGKVVPVSFRTARDWVAEWKKLRSAGKA